VTPDQEERVPDVVVAGAGPTGLLLACELVLAGARPLVLERLTGPATEPKANGLVGQVVRLLDRRGLYEPIAVAPGPPQPAPGFVFGALPLDLAGLTDNPLTIAGVPQRRLEEVLRQRAAELGVPIRWDRAVTAFTQDAGGVTVEIDGAEQVRVAFLVGADGGHSSVRKLAGIGFPGVTRDDTVSRAAHADVPAEWVDARAGELLVPGYGPVPAFRHHRTPRGLVVWAPFPGSVPLLSTVEWGEADTTTPMTLDEMAESLRRVLGADLPLIPPTGDGPFLLRRLTAQNTRLADRFRAGRAFLAGDAAHVHSGIGGPGLNLGLQDAVNLAWKLAAEVRGWAPPGLLDTYEGERRPACERVVMSTQAQNALLAPGPEVTALRELMTELLGEPATVRHIAGLMAGADVRYGTGVDHPAAGLFAPDLTVDGIRLAERCRSGRPLLVDGTGALGPVAAGWSDRVEHVAGALDPPVVTAMLVRPDSYVAWASSDPEPDPAGAVEALERWFGVPAAVVA
jgi:2-polyprenyl-6-methoxyphenol hydroxylase-like FAD-dependent oxidoreductase